MGRRRVPGGSICHRPCSLRSAVEQCSANRQARGGPTVAAAVGDAHEAGGADAIGTQLEALARGVLRADRIAVVPLPAEAGRIAARADWLACGLAADEWIA